MNQKQLSIAYCAENQLAAFQIAQQLQPAGYQLEHYVSTKDAVEQPLLERLEAVKGQIIILVSDNFLKSTACMAGALRFFQNHAARILPVVVEGSTVNEETGETVAVTSQFERVSDIIQYINHWQDRYLDIRRQKRHLEGIDEEGFNAHLKIMRDISSEIGEFLRLLRGAEFVSLTELQNTNYERFFRFTGDEDNAWKFQLATDTQIQDDTAPSSPVEVAEGAPAESMSPEVIEELISEPHLDLSDIPGISLLPDMPEAEAQQIEEELASAHEDVEQFMEMPVGESTPAEPVEVPVEPIFVADEPLAVSAPEELVVEMQPQPTAEEVAAEVSRIMHESSQLAVMGKKEESLAVLTQAIADYPDHMELRYPYALSLVQNTDDLAEAANQLEVLLAAHPEHADGLFLQGELAEMRGDFPAAKAAYEKLTEVSPAYAEGWFRLGSVLQAPPFGDAERAAACFQKAVQLFPIHAEAHYQYGLLAFEAGETEKAEHAFRRTLELQPNHPFVWYDLALLFHRREDAENAYAAYQRAVINNPEFKTPQNDMAFEYHRAARSVKAAEIIEKEQSALVEMRDNLNRLEALLREREEELQQLVAKSAPNQTVLITGATSGIGRATAFVFAEHGYRLILTGRRAERLEAVKIQLETEFEAQVHTLLMDVRNAAAVQTAIDNLAPEWKQIDILINNAGKAKGFDPIHEGHLEHWEEMIDTNLKGLLYVTRAVSPQMVTRGSGHIINIGSTAGKETYPKGNVYAATKFAVDALTKSMRLDLHTHNIRVSQVSPGHVEETEFALVRFDGDAERAKIYQDFKPLTSTDVAEAVYFMASRPAHVNIQDILMMGTQQASNIFIDRSGRHE